MLLMSLSIHGGLAGVLYISGSWTTDFGVHELIHIDFLEGSKIPKKVKIKPNLLPPAAGPQQASSVKPSSEKTSIQDAGRRSPYITQIVALLNKHKVYPREAIDREQEGKIIAEVVLNADGSIKEVKLQQKAVFDILNQAAIQTILQVGRFPPPPGDSAEFHFLAPIQFRIER